ncbi:MAG: sugar transferase [Clostridiales bacterium]|nr:sugar transferase [Clostridiales bacterium]
MKRWEQLPSNMQNDAVREYYHYLKKRTGSLVVKRLLDVAVSSFLILLLSPVLLLLALVILCDSRGGVFFRQKRVTSYGREFRIFKFRTMVSDAEKLGAQVTVKNDSRVTRSGRFLRRYRLDELPQLFNIFIGDMSLVGTRPEVPRYVAAYTDEMRATLLLPAGVTSLASIRYKDEDRLLADAQNADRVYTEEILPEKMKYNLDYLKEFSFFRDIRLMFQTVGAVLH